MTSAKHYVRQEIIWQEIFTNVRQEGYTFTPDAYEALQNLVNDALETLSETNSFPNVVQDENMIEQVRNHSNVLANEIIKEAEKSKIKRIPRDILDKIKKLICPLFPFCK